jgi:hypothetical protein
LVEVWPDSRKELRRRLRAMERDQGRAVVKRWRAGRHGREVEALLEKLRRGRSRSTEATLLLDTLVEGQPRLLELSPADAQDGEGSADTPRS